MASDSIQISVYVPCFNAERYIEKCIGGIFGQTVKPDEVLIIDDGSTDNTVKVASRYPVKIIRHEKNKGLAAARNTGFKSAAYEYVASFDSDVVPEPDWIETAIKNFTEAGVAGVGGKMTENFTGTIQDYWRSVHMKQHWGDSRVINPNFLFGADTIYKKSAVEKVGYFNEKYRTNYEDVDLCLRLKNAGYAIIYDPDARAKHYLMDTKKSLLRRIWGWSYSSREKNLKNVVIIMGRATQHAIKICLEDLFRERSLELIVFDIVQWPYLWWRAITFLKKNEPLRYRKQKVNTP